MTKNNDGLDMQEKMTKCVQAAIGFILSEGSASEGKWVAATLKGTSEGPISSPQSKVKLDALATEMLLDELKSKAPDVWRKLSLDGAFEKSFDVDGASWLAGNLKPWSELAMPIRTLLIKKGFSENDEMVQTLDKIINEEDSLEDSQIKKPKTKAF